MAKYVGGQSITQSPYPDVPIELPNLFGAVQLDVVGGCTHDRVASSLNQPVLAGQPVLQ